MTRRRGVCRVCGKPTDRSVTRRHWLCLPWVRRERTSAWRARQVLLALVLRDVARRVGWQDCYACAHVFEPAHPGMVCCPWCARQLDALTRQVAAVCAGRERVA